MDWPLVLRLVQRKYGLMNRSYECYEKEWLTVNYLPVVNCDQDMIKTTTSVYRQFKERIGDGNCL